MTSHEMTNSKRSAPANLTPWSTATLDEVLADLHQTISRYAAAEYRHEARRMEHLLTKAMQLTPLNRWSAITIIDAGPTIPRTVGCLLR